MKHSATLNLQHLKIDLEYLFSLNRIIRNETMRFSMKFSIGMLCLIAFAILHLFVGSTPITVADIYDSLVHFDASNTHHIVAKDLRIPRLMIAIVAGAGLSVSGLLLQTLFKNPLADPNILGVSTGSSLFVALTILTGFTFLQTDWGIISSALLGAFFIGLVLLLFARYMKFRGSLLLIGIMIGSFSASFISILQAYSEVNQLKSFTMWSMGSLTQVSFAQLPFILLFFTIGICSSFFLIRSLNAMTLGTNNAATLGVNVKQTRILIIFITSILTGLTTAFCGPIAFIGMAVPNIVRMLFKTQNHLHLILGNIIIGALFLLFCDILVQLLSTQILIPINAITSIIGAPFVIYIILKRWS